MNTRSTLGGGTLLGLALLFIGLTILFNHALRGWRLDLTQNRLYTTAAGTDRILASIKEPINLYFFFSAKTAAQLPQLKTYGVRVREFLEELAARSGGRLRLHVIDPQPFSEEEDRASELGVRGTAVGASGTQFYFGLAGTNSTDGHGAIEFFDPNKEQFLEYDVVQQVYQLANPQKPVVAWLIDQLDDVVLEELLLVGIEELDGAVAVGGIGSGQAEIELRTAGSHGSAAHAELGGAVLLLRERLRVDYVQAQPAAGARGELLEELAHPHAVGLQLRQLRRGLCREEEIQVDRLLDAGEDPVGSHRGGVETILREIQPPAAQRVVEQYREADEQQREPQERAAAECRACVHRSLRRLSAIAVASRKKPISIAKYSRSRTSMTPLAMDSKWVRNESEAIASTSTCGAQLRNTSSTRGKPASRNTKQPATPRMNATTWLRVSADMHEPMARKPPASSRLPR